MHRPCSATPNGSVLIAVGVPVVSRAHATVPIAHRFGPQPDLPAPNPGLIPTVNMVPATGLPAGITPVAAQRLSATKYAAGFDHPRWLCVLPNGDVLVAESDAPPKQDGLFSLEGWVMGVVMVMAGPAVPSGNRISPIRNADRDGIAEPRTTFLSGLNSPFGMTLMGHTLFNATTDAIVAFPCQDGATRITAVARRIVSRPASPFNHYWAKDVIASPDGTKLSATGGSNSNVGENGIDAETNRAAVLEIDHATRKTSIFASGLRNPNGPAWQPDSGALWVAVNDRDEIGSDLVPDSMTLVRDGGFYGWPYSDCGQHVDARVKPPRPDPVQSALVPDHASGAQTGSLGLTCDTGPSFPAGHANGGFVGQYGSGNRQPPAGYKQNFVPFSGGRPAGDPTDLLTGFLNAKGKAKGRAVGVAMDARGALPVADDVGNVVAGDAHVFDRFGFGPLCDVLSSACN